MSIYSRKELEAKGLVKNPNMWLSSGFLYCKVCEKHTYHYAMSTLGKSDCYEICKECDNYSK